MAKYGRKYRRTYRRNRRTLSTRNIWANRSSRSQAAQISALKRRVRAVSRACRPEVKIWNSDAVSTTFDNSALANNHQLNPVFRTLDVGTAEGQMIGDQVRIKSVCMYGTLEYYNNSATQYHDSEPAGGFIRFIYFQTKAINVAPVVSEILDVSSSGAGYEINCEKPLINGFSAQFRVLGDYKYAMNPTRNHILFKHRLPIKFKNSLLKIPPVSQEIAMNSIYVLIVTSGLHWDTNFTESISANRQVKVAYTDA